MNDILYEVDGGIGRVTFNRPHARNAFTFAMYARLQEICREAQHDASVKVLLLTGAGDGAFSAGTDIAEFLSVVTREDALAYENRIEGVLDAMERCRLPIVAAIAGACTGGGAAIAACCDIRIAAAGARFGMPVARTLGNCLSMANYVRLVALLGPARVKDLIFSARLIGAEEAHAMGLWSEVLPDSAALQARATELSLAIASHAPLTLQVTKEALRRIKENMNPGDDPEAISLCYTSHDFREGMEAFLSKRAPRWTGA